LFALKALPEPIQSMKHWHHRYFLSPDARSTGHSLSEAIFSIKLQISIFKGS